MTIKIELGDNRYRTTPRPVTTAAGNMFVALLPGRVTIMADTRKQLIRSIIRYIFDDLSRDDPPPT